MVDVLDLSINTSQFQTAAAQADQYLTQIGRSASASANNIDEFGRRLTAAGEVSSRYIPKFRGVMEALQIGQNVRSLAQDLGTLSNPLTSVGEVASNVAQNMLLLGVNFAQFARIAGPGAAAVLAITTVTSLLSGLSSRAKEAAQDARAIAGAIGSIAGAQGPSAIAGSSQGLLDTIRKSYIERDLTGPLQANGNVPFGTVAQYLFPNMTEEDARKAFTGAGGYTTRDRSFGGFWNIATGGDRQLTDLVNEDALQRAIAHLSQNARFSEFDRSSSNAVNLAVPDDRERSVLRATYGFTDKFAYPTGPFSTEADRSNYLSRQKYAGDVAAYAFDVEKWRSAGQDIGSALSQAFSTAPVDGLRKALTGLLSDLEAVATKALITQPLQNLFGGLFGSLVPVPSRGPVADRSGGFVGGASSGGGGEG